MINNTLPKLPSTRQKAVLFILVLVTVLAADLVRAGLVTKSPTGTDLTAPASWGGTVPNLTNVACWTTNSLGAGLTLGSSAYWGGILVTDALSDIQITGNGTLVPEAAGIDMSAATVNLSLANPILLGTNQTWNVNAGQTLSVSGAISSGWNLVKNGAGTLSLSANNPMTGLTTVNAGTLVITGQIHYNENWQHLNTLTINPGACVRVGSGDAENFLGQCNYNATYNNINGGILQFNTASGVSESIDRCFAISTNGGTLQVLNPNATLVFNYFSDPMQFSIPGPGSLVLSGSGNGVMNKILSGLGGLIKDGPGAWTLNQTNNYGGPTIVSNGTLMVNCSIWSAPVTVNAGGTLGGIGTIPGNITFLPGAQALFTNGAVLTCGGTLTLNNNTVQLNLKNLLPPGNYLLATYSAGASTGSFNPAPVINYGSLSNGCSALIQTDRGNVSLIVLPPPAPHLAVVSVNGGANPTAGLGFSVVVQAQDTNNNPIVMTTSTNVSLLLNAGYGALGGTLTGAIPAGSSSTVISGVTYNLAEGNVVITATNSGGALQPGNSSPFAINLGPATNLILTSSGDWSGAPGTTLPTPFIVTVTDPGGNPVPGVGVTFALTGAPNAAGGQSLSTVNTVTAPDGTAATTLTLGDKLGTYTVTASVNGLNINLVITATATNRDWNEVWSDEFSYNGLPDSTKWNYENGFVRNGESQYYTTNRLANACVTNGVLAITARQEVYTPPGQYSPVADYTSASLITLGKESWTYGRMEARAKLPKPEGGVWNAFWAQGTNFPVVGWPKCGELDIMEYVSWNANPHGNAFWSYNGGTVGKGVIDYVNDEPWNDFHVYAMNWYSDHIDYFYDNTNYFTLYMSTVGSGTNNPFYDPQYLLINFALGGQYGGTIYNAGLPQSYLIDYVRVYQLFPTWAGSTNNNLWSTAGNWTNGVPPKYGDSVVFNSPAFLHSLVDGAVNLGALTFYNTAGSNIVSATNGGTLTLAGGIGNFSTNGQTLQVPILLAASQKFNADSGPLTISGAISGSGFGLNKIGTNLLTLLAPNTYGGVTTVTAGTLALGPAGSLLTSGYNIAAGATLDLSAVGNYPVASTVSLGASGTGMAVGASAANLKAGSNSVVYLNSNPINLVYDGSHPSLYVSSGALSLSGNAFTINTTNGTPLPPGAYPVIWQANSNILSQGNFPLVGGTAIGPGLTGCMLVSTNTVNLVVAATSPVCISPPVIQGNGTVRLNFTGGNAFLNYRVQVCTNLASGNWITVFTNGTGTNGLSAVIDVSASNNVPRFYRTVTP